MQNVTQMISLLKKTQGVSKDKEVEELLGMRPMGLASLKRENRVGSFLKFLVPYVKAKGLSVDTFLIEVDEEESKFSNTGTDNPVTPPKQTRRDIEMDSLKDKLIIQMELCQKLQSDVIERDITIASLNDQLLGKPLASAKTVA